MVKRLYWIGSTLKDVKDVPENIRQEVGYSLYLAQKGDKAINAVPLVGFNGAKVLEIVIDGNGDTYRAVYRSNSRGPSTCCMRSRKSRKRESPPRSTI